MRAHVNEHVGMPTRLLSIILTCLSVTVLLLETSSSLLKCGKERMANIFSGLLSSCSYKTITMANSKFEYVRHFEMADNMLPSTWLVVRIDGRGFHRFSQTHNFAKPNDRRAIELMNRCAIEVMKDIKDIILAYGQSDEYSFIIPKSSNLYSRRSRWVT